MNQPPDESPENGLYKNAAEFFRILGEPNRLRILTLLLKQDMTVSEIADVLEDNLPAVSQRLTLMRNNEIITQRREGRFTICSLEDPDIRQFVEAALSRASL